jgi:hypothetical protein
MANRFQVGTTDVPTAGTQVRLSTSANRVRWIRLSVRSTNTGVIYFGQENVSSALGVEIEKDTSLTLDFENSSEAFSSFWVDAATSGDDVDWIVIFA